MPPGTLHCDGRITTPRVVPGYPLVVNVTNLESSILAGWRRLTIMIVGIAGAAIGLIGLARFLVTRQFAMQSSIAPSEAERAHAERARAIAEAGNRAKSGFLANLRHELRTPLNAVIGFTDLLASCRFGPLIERQGNYACDIGVSGRHLLGLIDTVLDMSKIEAGRGIAPERLANIFEPFQSADEHLSRDLGGTGLGFSIGKLLTEMHGGTLSIESTVGKGTAVTVRLPADRIIRTDGSPSSARQGGLQLPQASDLSGVASGG